MKDKPILILELEYLGQTERFESKESSFIIGRAKNCYLSLPKCGDISREHLKVEVIDNEIWITDLQSTNGSIYQDQKLVPHLGTLYTGGYFVVGSVTHGLRATMKINHQEKIQREIEIRLPLNEQTSSVEIISDQVHSEQASITASEKSSSIDENLFQMQEIEGELAELAQKRESLIDEVRKLSTKENQYVAMDQVFRSQQAELMLVQHDLEKKIEEVATAQIHLEEIMPKLEAQLVVYRAKESEITVKNDELEAITHQTTSLQKLLEARQKEVRALTEQWQTLSTQIAAGTDSLESLQLKIENLQSTFTRLEATKLSAQHELEKLEKRLHELDVQSEEAERIFTQQREQESLEIARLKESASAAEVSFISANAELERIQKRSQITLDMLEAETRLKKAVLDREIEEFNSRKTVITREIEDGHHDLGKTKKDLKALAEDQERASRCLADEQSRLKALRTEVNDLETQKMQSEVRLNEFEIKQSKLEREIDKTMTEAKRNAHMLILFANNEKEKIHADTNNWVIAQKEAFELEQSATKRDLEKIMIETKKNAHLLLLSANEEKDKIFADTESWKNNQKQEIAEARQAHKREHDKNLIEAKKTADLFLLKANEESEATRQATLHWISDQKSFLEREQTESRISFEQTHSTRVKAQTSELAELERMRVMAEEHFQERQSTLCRELDEAKARVQAEQVELNASLELLRTSIDQAKVDLLSEFEQKRTTAQKEYDDNQAAFSHEFEEAKRRALQEHELTLAGYRDAATQKKIQYAEELRVWSTDEEARVKKLTAQNVEGFAHSIAMRTLSEFQSSSSVSVSSLISTLETKLAEAFTGQVQGEGIYNPDFKKGVRKFWVQASAALVAGIFVLAGIQYGPKFVGKKLEIMKVANQEDDARFMKEVKLQREQMLALHLEAKDVFQEKYIDNVLYNPGYLAMKLDPEVQKLWTVELSKFFFEELLFDDRKVVDFMPIESALIGKLSETYHVLNSQNFEVNLVNMKAIDEEKTEEMWLLVGGHDNWVKLRKKESEFYAQHALAAIKGSRTPAAK